MKHDYDKMLKAFEKKHGNLADWKGTRESYFIGLSLFLDGWQAGKAFQQGVQRTAMPSAKIKRSGATRRR